MCDRVGHIMNYGDGFYGGVFVAAMYAAAFVQDDPREIVASGLKALPPDSGYAEVIRDVLLLHMENTPPIGGRRGMSSRRSGATRTGAPGVSLALTVP